MPNVIADAVQETAPAPSGSAPFVLAGAVSSYFAFAASMGDGNSCNYTAFDSAGNREIGSGTFTLSGDTLSRTSVEASTNGGAHCNFSGVVTVFLSVPASFLNAIPNANLAYSSVTVTAGAGLTGGGAVSLGSSVTLSVDETVIAAVASLGTLAFLNAAPAVTLTGATLAANVVNSSLTAVGTIATGVWKGTAIDNAHIANGAVANLSGTNTGDQTIAGLSPLSTKGDLFTYSTVNIRLGVGTNGYVLNADSTQGTGLAWFNLLGTANTWTAAQTRSLGTITTSQPDTWTQTWNNSAVTFTGLKLNVTNTASAAGSKLLDIQLAGVSKTIVDSAGNLTIGATSALPSAEQGFGVYVSSTNFGSMTVGGAYSAFNFGKTINFILYAANNTSDAGGGSNQNGYMLFGSTLNTIIGKSTYTDSDPGVPLQINGQSGGGLKIAQNNIATTSTDGIVRSNSQVATVSVQQQYSPRDRDVGAAWNTGGTPATNVVEFIREVRPVAGNPPTGNLVWSSRISTNGSGSFTDVMTLTSGGNLGLGASPSTYLDVQGAFNTQGQVRIKGISADSQLAIDTDANNRSASITFFRQGAQKAQIYVPSNSTTLTFTDNIGNDNVFIFSGGNVGLKQKISSYGNVSTVGLGVPALYGLDNRTGCTAADGVATTLYTTAAANQIYRVSADIFATAAVTGTANYTITWTENGTTQTSTVSATAINVLGTATNMIRPDNGTAITAQLLGTFTGTFSVVGTVERIA